MSRGATQALNRLFREHPLRFPFITAVVGAGMLGWSVFVQNTRGVALWYVEGLGGIMLFFGLLLLPVGVVVAVRRRRNVTVLRCPACGVESREAARPFRVERPMGVEYTHVVCSACRKDFTVDRYAPLR